MGKIYISYLLSTKTHLFSTRKKHPFTSWKWTMETPLFYFWLYNVFYQYTINDWYKNGDVCLTSNQCWQKWQCLSHVHISITTGKETLKQTYMSCHEVYSITFQCNRWSRGVNSIRQQAQVAGYLIILTSYIKGNHGNW